MKQVKSPPNYHGLMVLKVEMDLSFLQAVLPNMKDLDAEILRTITQHEAAKGVYHHARRFGNTDQDIADFWRQKITESNNPQTIENIRSCLKYIDENTPRFTEAYRELESYLPPNDYSTTLYAMMGYDIGIVSEGNAFLNLGHPIFQNQNELVYFAMHELHHAVYTRIHPIYSLEELKTTQDLIRIIKYSTQLEGLAVYCSNNKRKRENQYTHNDYTTLNNKQKTQETVTQYFQILTKLENEPPRALADRDYSTLSQMSGGDRLWYVTGAYMAMIIDQKIGRAKLNVTIIDGPDSFFEKYQNCINP